MKYGLRAIGLLGLIALLFSFSARGDAAGIVKGPYLLKPTERTIEVCWVSSQPARGNVRYQMATGNATGQVAEKADAVYHFVRLTGLKPYTRYTYVVNCDGEQGTGSFITAAPPTQPFKFVAYGDTRSQPDKHAAVIADILKFKPDFVLQTGDLVANGANEAQWSEFFKVAEPLLRVTPYYPELGNHEGDTAPYFHYFDLPRYYSFDYGNIHFTALDSNLSGKEQTAQVAWLRKDLAAHQNATWRIVFFHHTPFTCVTIPSRREDAEKMRAWLEPILVAGRVQMVVNGHDHNYQHHYDKGINYIVTGGGGAPLYDVRPDTPYVKVAKSVYHHCEITVNGSRLSFRAVDIQGNVIDRFDLMASITK